MGIDAGVGEDAGTYHCRSAYETDKNTKRGKRECIYKKSKLT